jgi:hypothetical protein
MGRASAGEQKTLSTAARPKLASVLTDMVMQHGSPEERRLIQRHGDALARFLDHPDAQPNNPHTVLDIGLENAPVLKLNLIAKRHSPWRLIHQMGEEQAQLRSLAETVIRHRLRCHAGIKLTTDAVEYELYAYETPDGLLAREHFPGTGMKACGLPAAPYCYGYTSTGVLSAYADIPDVAATELEQELGFSLPHQGLKTKALLHSRRNPDGDWQSDKGGLEFLPFPSHMLTAALSRMQPNFSYLLHRGGRRRYGVIGIKGQRQLLYTTLFANRIPNKNKNENA